MGMLFDVNREKFILNRNVLGLSTVFAGLLYIPAFIYGYFWLWVIPFTGLIILFVHSMIDDAILRVSKKGDAAKQARVMIPEFVMMNVLMTVLLSLPFVLALWLSHAGHIYVVKQSGIDQLLWQFCLWLLREQDQLVQTQYPQIQIMLSNMFFMIFATIAMLVTSFKKIKQIFFVLFHRESYKFLQQRPYYASGSQFFNFILIFAYLIVITLQINPVPSVQYCVAFCIYFNFLIFFQVAQILSILVEDNIKSANLYR